jgi:hypothetical protein
MAWHGKERKGKERQGKVREHKERKRKGKARKARKAKERLGIDHILCCGTPYTWNVAHPSMELATLEFTHVEWFIACTFLEGTFLVDTWHLNCLDAYFLLCPLHGNYLVHTTTIFG